MDPLELLKLIDATVLELATHAMFRDTEGYEYAHKQYISLMKMLAEELGVRVSE